MKTTMDIASNLPDRAGRLAREQKATIRELIQEGLELAPAQRQARRKRPVRPVTFRGRGIRRNFRSASWAGFRKATYEGRGA